MIKKNANGAEIVRRMDEKGISQDRMAELCGISRAMMSYILRNLREPTLKVMAIIATELDCRIDDLLI